MQNQLNLLTLPVEIHQQIFSHLIYADLLALRLTCKSFQILLRDWKHFQNRTVFILSEEEHEKSNVDNTLSILNQESLKFSNLLLKEISEQHFEITPNNKILAYTNLKHLTLKQVDFSWLKFQDFITNFPNLNSLQFTDCCLKHGRNDGWTQRSTDVKKFEEFCENQLKHLNINVGEYGELDFYFARFVHVPLLQSIRIQYHSNKSSCSECSLEVAIEENFLKLLESASNSLNRIYIRVTDASKLANSPIQFASRFANFNVPNDCDGVDYQLNLSALETLYISSTSFKEPKYITEIRFQDSLFDKIIRRASKLKHLTLPWDIEFSDQNKLIRTLPKSLESINVNIDLEKYSLEEVYGQLPKLTKIVWNLLYNTNMSFLRRMELPTVKSLTLRYRKLTIDYQGISSTFTSLSTLKIRQSSVTSQDLQSIISNLSTLKVLIIDTVHKKKKKKSQVNDFGVTGIDLSYCNMLKNDGALEDKIELNESQGTGLPLSNLQELVELQISCSKISDVGIYYGMKFGPKIKIISIGCSLITTEGAFLLTTLNPSLKSLILQSSNNNNVNSDELKNRLAETNILLQFRNVCEKFTGNGDDDEEF